jgi:hypothetical protein
VDGLWVGDEVVEGLGRRHCEQAGDGYGDEEGDDERPGRGATSQMGTSVRFGDEPKACEEVYRAGRVGGREEGAVSRGAMDLSPRDWTGAIFAYKGWRSARAETRQGSQESSCRLSPSA